jgi:ribosomal protein S27E
MSDSSQIEQKTSVEEVVKPSEQAPAAPAKVSPEERGYRGRIAVLQNQNARLEARVKELEGQKTAQQAPEKAAEKGLSHDSEARKTPQGYIHCATCGTDEKDEVACKGCGTHLGSLEHAQKLTNCPSCHGTKLKEI